MNMEMKTCTKCKQEKKTNYFYLNNASKDKLCASCKDCMQAYAKENKQKIKSRSKAYREKNKKQIAQKDAERYQRDIEASRAKRRASDRRRKDKRREHDRKRMATDPIYRIGKALRARIRKALVNNTKHTSSTELLGCSIEQLRQHLESQFKPGMSWDNYGKRGWHIDHIIPCASFDLSDPAQQRICFHYTNLQPLWAQDNESKGDTMPDNHQPELAIPI